MRKTVILMIAICLFITLPALWLNTQQGIPVWGEFLPRKSDTAYGNIALTREDGMTRFAGEAAGVDFSAEMRWDGDHASVTFPDGETISGCWDGSSHLRAENGLPLAWESSISMENQRVSMSPGAKANILCRMDRDVTEQRGSVWMVVLGVVLYAVGALSFLFPEGMYFLGKRWQYNRAELSDAGIFSQKAGGVVLMICSAIVMYALFFI